MAQKAKSRGNNPSRTPASGDAARPVSNPQTIIQPDTLLDNLPEVVYSYDRTASTLIWVSNAIRDYGYEPQELINTSTWRELIAEEDRVRMRNMLEEGTGTGQRVRFQYMFRAADGDYRTVTDSILIDTDKHNHVIFNGIMSDVSETERTKQALRESESRLHMVVDSLPVITFALDKNGIFTLSEGKGLAALRRQPGEVVGLSIHDIAKAEPLLLDAARRSLAGEEVNVTVNIRDSVFDFHFLPQTGPEGVEAVLGFAFNVTEQRRAQLELEETRRQMQEILENLDKAVFSWDHINNRLHYISPACEAIYGVSQQSFYDDPMVWRRVIHPADYRIVDQMNERVVSGQASLLEYRILRPTGDIVWVDCHMKPVTDENGNVVRLDGVVSDISERKRTEEALRQSEERFRRLFEESPIGITVTGRDFHFLEANAKFCEMLGYTLEELKSLTFIDITHADDMETQAETARLAFEGKGPAGRGEKRFYKKNKEILWAMRTATIIRDQYDNFLYAIAMVEDITERKLNEDELLRLNEELATERQAIEDLNHNLEQKVEERTEELRHSYMALQDRNRELVAARTKATSDGLTGLRNHRAFQERIRQLVAKADEESGNVGLIMLDIDEFKRVNDTMGHQAGDEILKTLSQGISRLVERQDAYRYGGDEFAVVVYGKTSDEATEIAEAIRMTVQAGLNSNGVPVTISLGVASYPDTADSVDKLIYGADAAMYWAKSAGKNRVGIWGLTGREQAIPVRGNLQTTPPL